MNDLVSKPTDPREKSQDGLQPGMPRKVLHPT